MIFWQKIPILNSPIVLIIQNVSIRWEITFMIKILDRASTLLAYIGGLKVKSDFSTNYDR